MSKSPLRVASVLALLAIASLAPAHAAEVTVIHGIPGADGLPVDVGFGGDCVLTNVTFGAIGGPLTVPAGLYGAQVSLADAGDPCGGELVLQVPSSISLDESATIVANLTDSGTFTATQFPNDLRDTGADSRLAVRHTADAPAVDIYVSTDGGTPSLLFADIANGEQAQGIVGAATYKVGIVAAGTQDLAFGPVDLTLESGTSYFVYAVGSLGDGTFDLIIDAR